MTRLDVPARVWALATLLALLQFSPYWRAMRATPPGWTFTWNLSPHEDFLQYRVWFRDASGGPVVENRLTSEPRAGRFLVIPYYLAAVVARWTGQPAEFVSAWVGSILAFLFVLTVYAAVRQFVPNEYAALWIFVAALTGGGLGAYVKLIPYLPSASMRDVLFRLANLGPTAFYVDEYRGAYPFQTLFDTHSLVLWLSLGGALLAFYFALKEPSPRRTALAAVAAFAAVLINVYLSATLAAVAGSVILLLWRKGLPVAGAVRTGATVVAIAAITALAQVWIAVSGGASLPTWRGPEIHFSLLVLSFPALWLLVWGLGAYWRQAGLDECFLLGWVLGCAAQMLSSPFNPIAYRGLVTFQIPLMIVAGTIFFGRHARLTAGAAMLLIPLLGGSPLLQLAREWQRGAFNPSASQTFLSPEQSDLIAWLKQTAAPSDILLVDTQNSLWLGPDYPGRFYCAHVFLTSNYWFKKLEMERFFLDAPLRQAEFLRRQRVRYVYVPAGEQPARFSAVPGLVPRKSLAPGTILEFLP